MSELTTTNGSEPAVQAAAQPAQAARTAGSGRAESAPGEDRPLLDAASYADDGGTLLGGAATDGADGQLPGGSEADAAGSGAAQGNPEDPARQDPEKLPEGLHPLPDNATDAQREAFERKLRVLNGVPDEPLGYGDFGYGEAVDKTSEEYRHYTDAFHAAGLSPRQAKMLLEKHIEWSQGQVEHITRQQKEVTQQYRSKVRKDFAKRLGGEQAFTQFAETANRGFKATALGAGLSPEESTGLLAVVGDDPRFLKVFNHIGSMHREDALVTGAKPKAAEVSMEDIIARQFNKK